MLGGLIVAACTMPLVAWFGEGDAAKGYQSTMTAMSLLGVVLFLLCFIGTKERISQPREKESSYKEDFKLLWKNDQWRILCLAGVFFTHRPSAARYFSSLLY